MRSAEFFSFMRERERIRLRRGTGQPYPWTDDPILRQYKFTNVKREHDRTTRVLRSEFYDKHQRSAPAVCLLNCAIFRYFGTYEFARAIGWQPDFYPVTLKTTAKQRLSAGERVFTGAYLITNQGISAPKEEVVVDRFLAGLWRAAPDLVKIARETRRWEAVITAMRNVEGFGGTGFMAKEVILDSLFTPMWKGTPTDFDTWCPIGPGARRGLSRLLHGNKDSKLPERAAVQYMRQLHALAAKEWPREFVPLVLHDIQFQLCEWDKYERVRLGEGRPRSLYKPEKE